MKQGTKGFAIVPSATWPQWSERLPKHARALGRWSPSRRRVNLQLLRAARRAAGAINASKGFARRTIFFDLPFSWYTFNPVMVSSQPNAPGVVVKREVADDKQAIQAAIKPDISSIVNPFAPCLLQGTQAGDSADQPISFLSDSDGEDDHEGVAAGVQRGARTDEDMISSDESEAEEPTQVIGAGHDTMAKRKWKYGAVRRMQLYRQPGRTAWPGFVNSDFYKVRTGNLLAVGIVVVESNGDGAGINAQWCEEHVAGTKRLQTDKQSTRIRKLLLEPQSAWASIQPGPGESSPSTMYSPYSLPPSSSVS